MSGIKVGLIVALGVMFVSATANDARDMRIRTYQCGRAGLGVTFTLGGLKCIDRHNGIVTEGRW